MITPEERIAMMREDDEIPVVVAYDPIMDAFWEDEERVAQRSARKARMRAAAASAAAPTPSPVRRPETTVLYRYWDEEDLLLYVGITGHLPGRSGGHRSNSVWMDFAARATFTRYPNRGEARAAEVAAIAAEKPIFNQRDNSREVRDRLVKYLIDHGRPDLVAPVPLTTLRRDGRRWPT